MEITLRDVAFELDPARVPRDWVYGDAFQTTFVNALSLLFPEGEKFFVESVKKMQDRVTEPALLRQVAGFIGQEAMHGREHRAFNELMVAHGYGAAPAVEARLRGFLKRIRHVLTAKSQLAITCALEHFTALLGETLLRDRTLHANVDKAALSLWLWHALEETEHKAVAFDVYRAVGGGYVRRCTMMVLATLGFFIALAIVHTRLLWARGILFRPWRWARGLLRMWIWPGYLTRMIPAYLTYFRPRFHPDDRDASVLLATAQAELFGPEGALAAIGEPKPTRARYARRDGGRGNLPR
ncbi:MAG: metal-dependent hydrolase [Kofleriaceae bacterium]